jgi:hypothetical protein
MERSRSGGGIRGDHMKERGALRVLQRRGSREEQGLTQGSREDHIWG